MMEVYIETLTGTAFELRVSPFETVMSVKAKIQRLEGIPISQQHLIWQSKELEDENCLHDYSITDGCTLKLVLAMRGGPINTRRIPVEDPALREMAEYIEANKDEIWEKVSGNHQVTLLVFREGDQINFFRVVDKGDETLTPLTESISGESVYNLCDEDDDEEVALHETRSQNDITMKKMETLRQQMTVLSLNKKPKKKMVPGTSNKPVNRPHHPKLRSKLFSKSPCLPPVRGQDVLLSVDGDSDNPSCSNNKIEPSVDMESKSNLLSNSPDEFPGACASTSHSPSDKGCFSFPQIPVLNHPQTKFESLGLHPHLQQSLARLECGGGSIALNNFRPVISSRISGLESHHRHHHHHHTTSEPLNFRDNLHSVGPKNTNLDRRKDGKSSVETKSNIRHQDWRTSGNSDCSGTTDMIYAPHVIKNIPLERLVAKETWKLSPLVHSTGTRENLSDCCGSAPASRESKISTPDKLLLRSSQRLSFSQEGILSSPTYLPPMKLKKSNKRCYECGRKTGLATSYMCRCGNNFCASHRYAESHGCSYDYKAEGRKLLEQTNPVVLAPKLPKI